MSQTRNQLCQGRKWIFPDVVRFAVLPLILLMAACAPTLKAADDPVATVSFVAASDVSDEVNTSGYLLKSADEYYQAADGTRLALQRWLPRKESDDGRQVAPRAVILALHGFGDYANGLDEAGQILRQHGIAVYAYDQRGFGRSPTRGFWPGTATLVQDASDALALLRHQYPGKPVYLAGVSMGAAVATVTAATRPYLMDGVILVSPAVWDRDDMPWYQTLPLSVLSHSLPWLPVSGRGLDIWPSDNIAMLRRLARDPNMLSSVRVDMVAGLANLMDEARMRARDVQVPALIMMGRHDQVIPPDVMAAFARDIAEHDRHGNVDKGSATICVYDNGYHMLLRDLNGPNVIADMAAWVKGSISAKSAACR
ncbi:alpha/beta hydrolase [Thalassospira sp. TSL5-1]|uniref:alpha/beta hydrolase n=1 Tax=Thalassospira sp. TSL5-1 TaxID=1544451 RepID=UPI000AC5AA57|nr:alpha/beta hydrolase [Thalassospira sp. TSL5-1]